MALSIDVDVISIGLTTPPGSPSNGDRYLVGTGATGAWSGKDGYLAAYVTSAWFFKSPTNCKGLVIYDAATTYLYGHDGTAHFKLAKASVVELLTTKGDILTRTGSANTRLAVGTDGMVLKADSTATEGIVWGWMDRAPTFSFVSTAATAVGAGTRGIINTTASAACPQVPSGKTFKVLGVIASLETGTTNGAYDIETLLRNFTDAADVLLSGGTGTYTVSGGTAGVVQIYAAGTLASPLATLAAGKVFGIGWNNKGSSVAALSATQKAIHVWGVFV
jgi:hypothetical protein